MQHKVADQAEKILAAAKLNQEQGDDHRRNGDLFRNQNKHKNAAICYDLAAKAYERASTQVFDFIMEVGFPNFESTILIKLNTFLRGVKAQKKDSEQDSVNENLIKNNKSIKVKTQFDLEGDSFKKQGDNFIEEANNFRSSKNNKEAAKSYNQAAKSYQSAGAYYLKALETDPNNENIKEKCRNAYEDAGDTYGKLARAAKKPRNDYAGRARNNYLKALVVSPEDKDLLEKKSRYPEAQAHLINPKDKSIHDRPGLPPRQQVKNKIMRERIIEDNEQKKTEDIKHPKKNINDSGKSGLEAKSIDMLIDLYAWHYDIRIDDRGNNSDEIARKAIFHEIIKRVTLNQNKEVAIVKDKISQDQSPAIQNLHSNLNNHYKAGYDHMLSATYKLADAVGNRYDTAYSEELDSLSGHDYHFFSRTYELGEGQQAANLIKSGAFHDRFVIGGSQKVPTFENDTSLAAIQGIGISQAIKVLSSKEMKKPSNQTWDKYRDHTKQAYDVLTKESSEKKSFLQWIRKDDSPISHWFDKAFQKIGEFFETNSSAKRSENSNNIRGHHKFWKPAGYDYKKQLKEVEEHLHLKPKNR